MNPSDLDALAERSGLKLPPLVGRRIRSVPPTKIIVSCVAACAIVTLLIWLSMRSDSAALSTRLEYYGQSESPNVCGQRWAGSSVLFTEQNRFSTTVACGRPTNRIVTGHIEIARPTQ